MNYFILTAGVVAIAFAQQSQAGFLGNILGGNSGSNSGRHNGNGFNSGRNNGLGGLIGDIANAPLSILGSLGGDIGFNANLQLGGNNGGSGQSGSSNGQMGFQSGGSQSISWHTPNIKFPSQTTVTTTTTILRYRPIGNLPGIQKVVRSDGSIVWMLTSISYKGHRGARAVRRPNGSVWYLITREYKKKPNGKWPIIETLREVKKPNGEIQYIPYAEPISIGNRPGVWPIIKSAGYMVYMITKIGYQGQPGARPAPQPNGSTLYLITMMSKDKPEGDLPVYQTVCEVEGPRGRIEYIPYSVNPSGVQYVIIGTRPGCQPIIKRTGITIYMITKIGYQGQPGAKPVRQPDGSTQYLITTSSKDKPEGNLPMFEPVVEVEGPNGQTQYIPSEQVPSEGLQPINIGTEPGIYPIIRLDGVLVYMYVELSPIPQRGAKKIRRPDGTTWYLIQIISKEKPKGKFPVFEPVVEIEGPSGEIQYMPSGPSPSDENPNQKQPISIGRRPGIQPVRKTNGSMYFIITSLGSKQQPNAKPVPQSDGSDYYLITIISSSIPQGEKLPVYAPVDEVEGPSGQILYIPTDEDSSEPKPSGPYPSGEQPNGQKPSEQYPWEQYPIGQQPGVQQLGGQQPGGQTNSEQYQGEKNPFGKQPNGQYPPGPQPSGLQPSGQNPFEQYPLANSEQYQGEKNPFGKQPNGQYPPGPQPSGLQPSGQNPFEQYPFAQWQSPFQQQPGGQKPGGKQPGGQQLGGHQPGGQTTSEQYQGEKNPPGQQPNGQYSPGPQPSGLQPGGQKPVVQPPGGQQTVGEQPGGKQPGGQQLGGEQPGGQQPGGQQPGAQQPVGQQPGGQQPGGQQPGGKPGQTVVIQYYQQYPSSEQPEVQPVIKPNGSVEYIVTKPSSKDQPGAKPVPQSDESILYLLTVKYTEKPQINLPVKQPLQEVVQPNGTIIYIRLPANRKPGVQKVKQPNGSTLYIITRPCGKDEPGALPAKTPEGKTIYVITITTTQKPVPSDYEEEPDNESSIEYIITTSSGSVIPSGGKPVSIPQGGQPVQSGNLIGTTPGVQPVVKLDGSVNYIVTIQSSEEQPGAERVQQPDGSTSYLLSVEYTKKPQINLPEKQPLQEYVQPDGTIMYIRLPANRKPGVQKVKQPNGSTLYIITRPCGKDEPGALPVKTPKGKTIYVMTMITTQKPDPSDYEEEPDNADSFEYTIITTSGSIRPSGSKPVSIPLGGRPVQSGNLIGTTPGVQPVVTSDGSVKYIVTIQSSEEQPGAERVQQPDGSIRYLLSVEYTKKPQINLPEKQPLQEYVQPDGTTIYIRLPANRKPGVQKVKQPNGSTLYIITRPCGKDEPGALPVKTPKGKTIYVMTMITTQKPDPSDYEEEPDNADSFEYTIITTSGSIRPSGSKPVSIPPGGRPVQSGNLIGTTPGVQPVVTSDGSVKYIVTIQSSEEQPGAERVQQPDGSIRYLLSVEYTKKPQINLPEKQPLQEYVQPDGTTIYIRLPANRKPGVQKVKQPNGSTLYIITRPCGKDEPGALPVKTPKGKTIYVMTMITTQKPDPSDYEEEPDNADSFEYTIITTSGSIRPSGSKPVSIPLGGRPVQSGNLIGTTPGVQPVVTSDGSVKYIVTIQSSEEQPGAERVQQPDGSIRYLLSVEYTKKPQINLPEKQPLQEYVQPDGTTIYIRLPANRKPGVQKVKQPNGSTLYIITRPCGKDEPGALPVKTPKGKTIYVMTMITTQKPDPSDYEEEPDNADSFEYTIITTSGSIRPSGSKPVSIPPGGRPVQSGNLIGTTPGVQPVVTSDGSVKYIVTIQSSEEQPGAERVQQPDGSIRYLLSVEYTKKPQINLPEKQPLQEYVQPDGTTIYIRLPANRKPGVQKVKQPNGSTLYIITRPCGKDEPGALPVKTPKGKTIYVMTMITTQKPDPSDYEEEPDNADSFEYTIITTSGSIRPSGSKPVSIPPGGRPVQSGNLIGTTPGVQPVVTSDGSVKYIVTIQSSEEQPGAERVQQPDGSIRYLLSVEYTKKPQINLPEKQPLQEYVQPDGTTIYILLPANMTPGVHKVQLPNQSTLYIITKLCDKNQSGALPVKTREGKTIHVMTIATTQKPDPSDYEEEPDNADSFEYTIITTSGSIRPSGSKPVSIPPGGRPVQSGNLIGTTPGVQPVVTSDGSVKYIVTIQSSEEQPGAERVQQPDGSIRYLLSVEYTKKPQINLPEKQPLQEYVQPDGTTIYILLPANMTPGVHKVQLPNQSTLYIITKLCDKNQSGALPFKTREGKTIYVMTIATTQKPDPSDYEEEPDNADSFKYTIITTSGSIPPGGSKPVSIPQEAQQVVDPNGKVTYVFSGSKPSSSGSISVWSSGSLPANMNLQSILGNLPPQVAQILQSSNGNIAGALSKLQASGMDINKEIAPGLTIGSMISGSMGSSNNAGVQIMSGSSGSNPGGLLSNLSGPVKGSSGSNPGGLLSNLSGPVKVTYGSPMIQTFPA